MAWECKLTESQVIDIKYRILAGERMCNIAKIYDVNQSTISKIKNGYHWKDTEIEVDFVKYENYWSYFSPQLSQMIVKLYNDGYTQFEIADIMNQYVLTIDEKIRPKKICQPDVQLILKKNNVKINPRGKYVNMVLEMKKLHKKGLSMRKIGKELGIPACTVYRYLSGKNFNNIDPDFEYSLTPNNVIPQGITSRFNPVNIKLDNKNPTYNELLYFYNKNKPKDPTLQDVMERMEKLEDMVKQLMEKK